jgi:hypothetical protein
MSPHADLLSRPPGTYAITNSAALRLHDAGFDRDEVVRQHLAGHWESYPGETHFVTIPEHGVCNMRFSFCFTGADTAVLIAERAGILTLCCPADFRDFVPPPGGPR